MKCFWQQLPCESILSFSYMHQLGVKHSSNSSTALLNLEVAMHALHALSHSNVCEVCEVNLLVQSWWHALHWNGPICSGQRLFQLSIKSGAQSSIYFRDGSSNIFVVLLNLTWKEYCFVCVVCLFSESCAALYGDDWIAGIICHNHSVNNDASVTTFQRPTVWLVWASSCRNSTTLQGLIYDSTYYTVYSIRCFCLVTIGKTYKGCIDQCHDMQAHLLRTKSSQILSQRWNTCVRLLGVWKVNVLSCQLLERRLRPESSWIKPMTCENASRYEEDCNITTCLEALRNQSSNGWRELNLCFTNYKDICFSQTVMAWTGQDLRRTMN